MFISGIADFVTNNFRKIQGIKDNSKTVDGVYFENR